MLPRREEFHNEKQRKTNTKDVAYRELGSRSLVEAAEAGVAWRANGDGLFLVRRGDLRLGGYVGRDSGCTETGDGEGHNESANDVVFHG